MSPNSWQEHIAHVTAKGVLAKPLYVIFTKPANGLDAVRQHLAEHLQYQKDLEARGITFGAGPFANDSETEWSGEGMVIVRAASMQEARALAEADPMHRPGAIGAARRLDPMARSAAAVARTSAPSSLSCPAPASICAPPGSACCSPSTS